MPRPHPINDQVIKGLKTSFPFKQPLKVLGEVYAYEDVKEAVYGLKACNPEMLKILTFHLMTDLSRARIAEEVGFDSSTVKRCLDKCSALIMQRLNHGDLPPADLFSNRNPVPDENGVHEVTLSPFPRINWRND